MRALAINGARVRRGGGAPPPPDGPDVIFGSALLSWHRADLGVSDILGSVTDWADQSGNGRDFAAAFSPTLGTNAGQAALVFVGSSTQYLTLSGTSYGSPSQVHVIRVLQRNADPAPTTQKSGLDDWGTSAAKSHIPYTDGTVYDSTGGTTRATVGNPSTSLATLCTYESTATGSAFVARVNGSVVYSGASIGVAIAATPWIGGGSHGAYMDGYLSEVIVLNTTPDATQRSQMAAYILDRYGLTIS